MRAFFTLQKRNSGFSLVELLVALALGAALIFGVLQIFDSNKRTSQVQHALAEVQNNGRIAAELISRDIRMADSWGCATDTGVITDHLSPTQKYAAISGEPALDSPSAAPGGLSLNIAGKTPLVDTEVLVVRGAHLAGDLRLNSPAMVAGAFSIRSTVYSEIPAGTIMLASDCDKADRFVLTTNIRKAIAGSTAGFDADASPINGVSNASAITDQSYDQMAELMFPFTHTFFVAENDVGGNSLYRLRGGAAGQLDELVRNVESITFNFGVDGDAGDGQSSVTEFKAASLVTTDGDWDNVLSVRTILGLKSANNVISSGPLTRTYTFTTNIRNRTL